MRVKSFKDSCPHVADTEANFFNWCKQGLSFYSNQLSFRTTKNLSTSIPHRVFPIETLPI